MKRRVTIREWLAEAIEHEKIVGGFRWLWYMSLAFLVFLFWLWAITSDS